MSASIPQDKNAITPTRNIPEVELLSLLGEAEAAKILNLSPRTLQSWRQTGRGPRYVKCGSKVGYRLKDLIEFTESGVRDHTSQERKWR